MYFTVLSNCPLPHLWPSLGFTIIPPYWGYRYTVFWRQCRNVLYSCEVYYCGKKFIVIVSAGGESFLFTNVHRRRIKREEMQRSSLLFGGAKIYSIPYRASYFALGQFWRIRWIYPFLQIILVQFILFFTSTYSSAKQQAQQGIDKFCYPSRSDDLCLFFCAYLSFVPRDALLPTFIQEILYCKHLSKRYCTANIYPRDTILL